MVKVLSKNCILICFIGTDGTGKSTLAKLIGKDLASKGMKIKITYGRHKYYLSRPVIVLGRRIFLKNKNVSTDYDRYLYEKRITYKKYPRLIGFFVNLIMADYLIQLFFKVFIPLRLGYTVVADRYLYDTIINELAIDRNLTLDDVKKIYNKYEKHIPSPNIVFLVEIPEDIAMLRKNDIPSRSYLSIRNEFYRQFASRDEIITLDGTLPISQLRDEVVNTLSSKLGII
jgi:dTMP kinase